LAKSLSDQGKHADEARLYRDLYHECARSLRSLRSEPEDTGKRRRES
jgi:hypothetical protein